MKKNLSLQELNIAVAVATKNHKPSILSPEFVGYSRILPDDWELALQPIISKLFSQVLFKNAFTIVAQPQFFQQL